MKKTDRELDSILEECLERALGGETIEQCLRRYPQWAHELRPLLETVLDTKQAVAIQPRAEFKAKARYQFRSALLEKPGESRLLFNRQRWWVTAVAALLVLLLAGGGMVAAAGGSMPDGPLYQVKLATEQVWLSLTPSAVGKAEVRAQLADRRVTEIIYEAGKGDPEKIEQATRRAGDYLASIAGLTGGEREQGVMLMGPEAGAGGAADSAPPTASVTSPDESTAELRAILVRYAASHPVALQSVLDTAPESTKPALRQAIEVLVSGYQEALEAVGAGTGR